MLSPEELRDIAASMYPKLDNRMTLAAEKI